MATIFKLIQMTFFKKLFGSKATNEYAGQEDQEDQKAQQQSFDNIPWMTDTRRTSLKICHNAGFSPALSLPTEFERELRPAMEISKRLHGIKALILWLMVPEENLPSETILDFVKNNQLDAFITAQEAQIFQLSRTDEDARNAIGWKFENTWPLAWYFGYIAPDFQGEMMSGEQMQEILQNYTCSINANVAEWTSQQPTISEAELIQKEDLFYCLHNAVRSAQLGSETIPPNFHPIGNGGVIYERRHSLTWMLSNGIEWDDTDLST